MIKILANLAPAFDEENGAVFVGYREPIEVTRVPCVGELLHFGEDRNGIRTDYRVEMVRHFLPGSLPIEAVAEVYANRVDLVDVKGQLPVFKKRLAPLGAPLSGAGTGRGRLGHADDGD